MSTSLLRRSLFFLSLFHILSVYSADKKESDNSHESKSHSVKKLESSFYKGKHSFAELQARWSDIFFKNIASAPSQIKEYKSGIWISKEKVDYFNDINKHGYLAASIKSGDYLNTKKIIDMYSHYKYIIKKIDYSKKNISPLLLSVFKRSDDYENFFDYYKKKNKVDDYPENIEPRAFISNLNSYISSRFKIDGNFDYYSEILKNEKFKISQKKDLIEGLIDNINQSQNDIQNTVRLLINLREEELAMKMIEKGSRYWNGDQGDQKEENQYNHMKDAIDKNMNKLAVEMIDRGYHDWQKVDEKGGNNLLMYALEKGSNYLIRHIMNQDNKENYHGMFTQKNKKDKRAIDIAIKKNKLFFAVDILKDTIPRSAYDETLLLEHLLKKNDINHLKSFIKDKELSLGSAFPKKLYNKKEKGIYSESVELGNKNKLSDDQIYELRVQDKIENNEIISLMIKKGLSDEVMTLIDRGFPFSCKMNEVTNTDDHLQSALLRGFKGLALKMIEKGCDQGIGELLEDRFDDDLQKPYYHNDTHLGLAIRTGNIEVAKKLIKKYEKSFNLSESKRKELFELVIEQPKSDVIAHFLAKKMKK